MNVIDCCGVLTDDTSIAIACWARLRGVMASLDVSVPPVEEGARPDVPGYCLVGDAHVCLCWMDGYQK